MLKIYVIALFVDHLKIGFLNKNFVLILNLKTLKCNLYLNSSY